jgi:hypothetical protein
LLIAPIPLHLIPQLQISLLRTVSYTPKRTVRGGEKRNFTTKKIISIFPLWTLPGCIIPEAPAYGVYISKLIRYSKTCGSYQDFLDGELLPTRKLLNLLKLKVSLRHFSVPTMTLLTVMEYICHQWPRICSTCRMPFPALSSCIAYHRICN